MWLERSSLWAERLAWTGAVVAFVFWIAADVSGRLGMRSEMRRFAAAQAAVNQAENHSTATPDQSLWSAARVRAWRDAQTQQTPPPLAVMRIRRIGLEVPVLEGTDESTLNRAVGHIEGTVKPGAEGNAGIAGHRDGFFRVLKDIQSGDLVELETLHGPESYRVEHTWIVQPEDVSVLDPTSSAAITLVTCYPFYFVGSAPQRFIVRAVRTNNGPARE